MDEERGLPTKDEKQETRGKERGTENGRLLSRDEGQDAMIVDEEAGRQVTES